MGDDSVSCMEYFFYLVDSLRSNCPALSQRSLMEEICLYWQASLWLLSDPCPVYALLTIVLALSSGLVFSTVSWGESSQGQPLDLRWKA